MHTDPCLKVGAGSGGGGGGGKVKRQVWTATAIEAFSEGLYQVLVCDNTIPC